MFEKAILAVVGVVGGTGSVKRCIDCRETAGPDGKYCSGFGVGCLTRDPQAEAAPPGQPPEDSSTKR
jgi:hypothetical protein